MEKISLLFFFLMLGWILNLSFSIFDPSSSLPCGVPVGPCPSPNIDQPGWHHGGEQARTGYL